MDVRKKYDSVGLSRLLLMLEVITTLPSNYGRYNEEIELRELHTKLKIGRCRRVRVVECNGEWFQY